jgi:hypothetical protein
MADKKKDANSAKDPKTNTSPEDLRDLDMLDEKIDKVKGGRTRRDIRMRK